MRRWWLIIVVLFIAAIVAGVVLHDEHTSKKAATSTTSLTTTTSTPVTTTTSTVPTVTIASVGDTELGSSPDVPSDPTAYFAPIKQVLAAPIVFGNLEGTMTSGGVSKCATNSTQCYAFRVPTTFAAAYRSAGFTVLNSANNHSFDFGSTGATDTTNALRAAGIAQAGLAGQIAVVSDGTTKVAFVDFAPYPYTNDLLDIDGAQALIARAKAEANLVVVYMHAGAEGADADHVTKTTEIFDGENRGDPYAFAHAAIDDGADIVIASGPHVLRGIEFYRGHLIDYSLGDFANYGNFALDGDLDLSGILHVTVSATGGFRSATFTSVVLRGTGQPFVDSTNASANFVNQLSVADFASSAGWIEPNGSIVPYKRASNSSAGATG
jgi:poly-gamma-glutamate capsule biosynthesis protein CapA/YwtB (metallophosphatase superfamily)